MENIKVKVDGQEFETTVDQSKLDEVILDGENYKIEILKAYPNNVYTFLVNNQVLLVQYDETAKDIKVIHDNFEHKVEIKTETKALLEEFIKDSGLGDSESDIHAPMPGLVVKILTEEGAEIKKGDKLIIIEAMKMENALASTVDGVVKKIHVKEGVPVDKDAILIEIGEHE